RSANARTRCRHEYIVALRHTRADAATRRAGLPVGDLGVSSRVDTHEQPQSQWRSVFGILECAEPGALREFFARLGAGAARTCISEFGVCDSCLGRTHIAVRGTRGIRICP